MGKNDASLKDEVLELVAIATSCPPNLQEKCFEVLLTDLLTRRAGASSEQIPPNPEPERLTDGGGGATPPTPPVDTSSDIADSDMHTKGRHFLQKNGFTNADVNQLLYKEGGDFLPLYDDLKTTRMSESQIRLGLLEALRNGLKNGEFSFDGEQLRVACTDRKCYDPKNYTANFKNSAGLFDGFDGYSKQAPVIRLSEAGRKELADLMRQLL